MANPAVSARPNQGQSSAPRDQAAGKVDNHPLPLRPKEGWHVIHLFYRVNQLDWAMLSPNEKRSARSQFANTVSDIRQHSETQLLVFSMVTPKADIGMMLLTPDLHDANAFEKQLTLALGPGMLEPVYHYLSMTELSEYSSNEEEKTTQLEAEQGLRRDTPEMAAALEEYRAAIRKYNHFRLYPSLPTDWQVVCFYNMSKRRNPGQNWYAEDFAKRRELMAGHAKLGKTWHGKVRQLITGSTGLDEAEWGVTLFAHTTEDIKGIVYEMRFDEVSYQYAEFGDFFIGIQLPTVQALLERLALD